MHAHATQEGTANACVKLLLPMLQLAFQLEFVLTGEDPIFVVSHLSVLISKFSDWLYSASLVLPLNQTEIFYDASCVVYP